MQVSKMRFFTDDYIANMFFIPLALFTGGDALYLAVQWPPLVATWQTFLLTTLSPVILGNIVGGAILAAGLYAFSYKQKR